MDPFTGAAIAVALQTAVSALIGTVRIIISSRRCGNELNEMLEWLKPIIDDIISIEISESDSSFQVGSQFKKLLKEGFQEVEKIAGTHRFNIISRTLYGRRIRKFLKKLKNFIDTSGSPGLQLTMKKLDEHLRVTDADFRRYFDRLVEIVNTGMTNYSVSNTTNMLQQNNIAIVLNISVDGTLDATDSQQSISCTYQTPEITSYAVDLVNRVKDVKQILLQNDVNIVGVKGMGGSGKTTLVSALCEDNQVKEFFPNIIFITVSQFPNVKYLLDTMWDKIIGLRPKPDFQSKEDAHNQLLTALILKNGSSITYQSILVVLDDVWSQADLEDLLFEAKGYKTIFTSRENSIIPAGSRPYEMPVLRNEDSVKLFCFWAFRLPSIPTNFEDKDLVQQVVAACGGLPLALTVIGSCLHEQPLTFWRSAKEKLSKAESISPYHTEKLLNRLETSTDVLDDEPKQCFLDLGAFPKGKKFSVEALLDIWVYAHGMEWDDAFVVLLDLVQRNLLNLTSEPGSEAISDYRCASGIFFSQHDVMRDLAFRLGDKNKEDSTIQCSRLFMPHKEDSIPTKWISLKERTSKAQFVSIHTGPMEKQQWGQIQFPEVEILALFFQASQYCLPTFLCTMPKLKVVIIYNYSSKRAILHGLPNFALFTQIKSLVLEKLNVSALYKYCRSSKSLEKFRVCLCEGLGSTPPLMNKEPVKFTKVLEFPGLIEINFDHCSDLTQLPKEICNFTSLQRLYVTNCHLFENLPDDLGKLRKLKALKLSSCLNLSKLPLSICELHNLEFLDISMCTSLEDIPMGFDQLSNLKMLDMMGCSRLSKELPKAFAKLRSLARVICDEKTQQQWQYIKESYMPLLTIVVVVECPNIYWVDS